MPMQHEELRKLEREILDRVSSSVAIFSLGAVAVGAFDWWTRGRPYVITFTGLVLVASTISAQRRLAPRVRSTILVATSFGVSIASFHFFGYLAIPAVAMTLTVLLGHALVGPRFAMASAFAATASILTIGALQAGGVLAVAPGRELYAPDQLSGWIRVAFLFLMTTMAILHVIRSQQNLIERSLDEQGDALEKLRAKTEALERAQAERDRVEKRLRDAERLEAVGKLAGSVAHDMNNTLTVVLGSAEVLRGSRLEGEGAAIVEDLIHAAKSGSELCRQLLSCVSRSVLAPKDVAPTPFLHAVARLFDRLLPPDTKLALEIDDDLPLIHVDEAELQHALLNLLGNARDAIDGVGVISLRATSGDEKVWIEVADDGAGIADEIRDRVFEPLFSTKSESGGTGLGLPSVLGSVNQAGGTVELDSKVGRGTNVRLGFPILRTVAPLQTRDEGGPSELRRVLVVDDDPAISRLIVRMLGDECFEPTIVEDAEAALGALTDHGFDILLTDVVLPGKQGPELAELALQDDPDLRVVLMSGYMDDTSARAASDRALPLLPKPFTTEDLLEVLDSTSEAGATRSSLARPAG